MFSSPRRVACGSRVAGACGWLWSPDWAVWVPVGRRGRAGLRPRARVAVVGSRSWPGALPVALMRGVVASLVARRRLVASGCALGIDRLALSSLRRLGRRPLVFAAFGPSGRGSCRWSARVVPFSRVRFWAGGPCRCRGGCRCLSRRLAGRRRALVAWAARGGPGSGLVVFLGRSGSVGSLAAVRGGVAAGLPVVVFLAPGVRFPALPAGWLWAPCRGAFRGGWVAVAGEALPLIHSGKWASSADWAAAAARRTVVRIEPGPAVLTPAIKANRAIPSHAPTGSFPTREGPTRSPYYNEYRSTHPFIRGTAEHDPFTWAELRDWDAQGQRLDAEIRRRRGLPRLWRA